MKHVKKWAPLIVLGVVEFTAVMIEFIAHGFNFPKDKNEVPD